MSKIIINGVTHEVYGKNIEVRNGKVMVDGNVMEEGLTGEVKVSFEGDLATLECADATITGNVQGNVNAADVDCCNIGGDVNAAEVKCGDVGGDVNAAEVKCRNVAGSISAVEVKLRKKK